MLDIKEIRKNLEYFKKKLLFRHNSSDLDQVIILDKEYRGLIQKKELLEQQKKKNFKIKRYKKF